MPTILSIPALRRHSTLDFLPVSSRPSFSINGVRMLSRPAPLDVPLCTEFPVDPRSSDDRAVFVRLVRGDAFAVLVFVSTFITSHE